MALRSDAIAASLARVAHRYRRYRSPTRLRRRDILKIQDGGRKRAKLKAQVTYLI